MGYRGSKNNDQVKKSGAKYSIISTGQYKGLTIVNAWNASSKGLIVVTVKPYSGSKSYKSKRAEYQTMIAEVNYRSSGITKIIPVSMNKHTGTIVINDLGMVISKNGNGVTSGGKKVSGYFGKFAK